MFPVWPLLVAHHYFFSTSHGPLTSALTCSVLFLAQALAAFTLRPSARNGLEGLHHPLLPPAAFFLSFQFPLKTCYCTQSLQWFLWHTHVLARLNVKSQCWPHAASKAEIHGNREKQAHQLHLLCCWVQIQILSVGLLGPVCPTKDGVLIKWWSWVISISSWFQLNSSWICLTSGLWNGMRYKMQTSLNTTEKIHSFTPSATSSVKSSCCFSLSALASA